MSNNAMRHFGDMFHILRINIYQGIDTTMKFIRFGELKPILQKGYIADPPEYISEHRPPRKYGFYAFPYGLRDMFFISAKRGRCTMLKDDDGNYVYYGDCHYYDWNLGKDFFTPLGKRLLEKYKLRKYQLAGLSSDSVIRVMKDWQNPPKLLPDGHLDQKLGYLWDMRKHHVSTDYLKDRIWTMKDYDASRPDYSWTPMSLDNLNICDICSYILDIEQDRKGHCVDSEKSDKKWLAEQVTQWLAKQGIDVRQLCVWPIWPVIRTNWDGKEFEADMAVAMHKPHIFEYNGRLWHHFGQELKSGEMLGVYANTWFYSDVHAFEGALKRRDTLMQALNHGSVTGSKTDWSRFQRAQRIPGPSIPGPRTWLPSFGAPEVFIDGDDFK